MDRTEAHILPPNGPDTIGVDGVNGAQEVEALRQRVRELEQQLGSGDLASLLGDGNASRPRAYSNQSNVSLLGDLTSRARAYSSQSFLAFDGFRPRAISGQSTLSFLDDPARPRTLSNLAEYKLDLGDRLGALTSALNADRAFNERPNSPPGSVMPLPFLTVRAADSDPSSPRVVFPLLPLGSPMPTPGSAGSTTTNGNYSFPVLSFGAPPPPSGLSAVAAAAESLEGNSTGSSPQPTNHAGGTDGREVKRRRALKIPNQGVGRGASAAPESQRRTRSSEAKGEALAATAVAAVPAAAATSASEDQPSHVGVVIPVKPEPISVVKRKGTVLVLKWGAPPLAVERTIRGTAFVPDGFEVETISDRMTWIGQTRVSPPSNLQYRFYLKSDPTKTGGWHKNASRAYRDAFANLGTVSKDQLDNLKSSNGRLIIGVTYVNLQERIRKIFAREIAQLHAIGGAGNGNSSTHSAAGDDEDEDEDTLGEDALTSVSGNQPLVA